MQYTKQSKNKGAYPVWLKWQFWTVLVMVGIILMFTLLEKQSEVRQPSDNWSMGIDLDVRVSLDHRAFDVLVAEEADAVLVGNIHEGKAKVINLNRDGVVVSQVSVDLPDPKSKVLALNRNDQGLFVLVSNRDTLWSIPVALDSNTGQLKLETPKELSKGVEHFSISGKWLVVGDDETTRLFYEDTLMSEQTGYNNLRNLELVASEDASTCYYVIDADSGSSLYSATSDSTFNSTVLMTAQEVAKYGFVRDMFLQGETLTLASHKYNHLEPNSPTIIGIWQYDMNTLDQNEVFYYYHTSTNLEPQLVAVDGMNVSYILGMPQTISMTGAISRYPQTESGKITNVSMLTREGDLLVANERMTLTREYPIFYKNVIFDNENVLVWVDRRAGLGHLKIAGQGESWIKTAASRVEVDWALMLMSSVMGLGNSLVIGVMYAAIMLLDAKFAIPIAAVILWLIHRFAPIEAKKRSQLVFVLAVLATIGIKWYVFGYLANDMKFFAYMYPFFFGSEIVLQGTQILTSVLSLTLYSLWHREHPYYVNRWMHYGIYIGFEVLFLLSITISLFMNAMMKMKFMM